MRLGIDLDGVVVDFVKRADAILSQACGVEPGTVVVDNWDWYPAYGKGAKAAWKAMWEDPTDTLFLGCDPIPGACEALRYLQHRGHELVFVTHRKPRFETQTRMWLNAHDFRTVPVIHTADKSEVEWDLHLDDKPETVDELVSAGRRALLFKQPWNRDWWDRLDTVNDWGDFVLKLGGWA